MSGCIYQHIGDDGVIVCNHFSDFQNNIISYCDPNCVSRKPSNADRIRGMSDEELSEFLMKYGACTGACTGCDCMSYPCESCWIDWLREECE